VNKKLLLLFFVNIAMSSVVKIIKPGLLLNKTSKTYSNESSNFKKIINLFIQKLKKSLGLQTELTNQNFGTLQKNLRTIKNLDKAKPETVLQIIENTFKIKLNKSQKEAVINDFKDFQKQSIEFHKEKITNLANSMTKLEKQYARLQSEPSSSKAVQKSKIEALLSIESQYQKQLQEQLLRSQRIQEIEKSYTPEFEL
jgi:hypothetical protein